MNAHLPCTTLYYNYVRLSTGLCKYFKQGSEANIRVHQMSGSTAGWSEIRSAVREEAGQGGTQARQRFRHLSQDAALDEAYIRRTRRNAAKDTRALRLLGLDSDTFYIYHVAAVMVDNLRRLLLGINLSDKAIMDFDFPGVGFPV